MWLVIGSNSISELLFFVVLLGVSLNKQLFKYVYGYYGKICLLGELTLVYVTVLVKVTI